MTTPPAEPHHAADRRVSPSHPRSPCPRATFAGDSQLDKMRAKIAAFITDKMEKQGGSRIVYKVDADALAGGGRHRSARRRLQALCARAGSPSPALRSATAASTIKIADAKSRHLLKRKLASAAEGSAHRTRSP